MFNKELTSLSKLSKTGPSFLESIFYGAVSCITFVMFLNAAPSAHFMICIIIFFQVLLSFFKTKKMMQKTEDLMSGFTSPKGLWVNSTLIILLLGMSMIGEWSWMLGVTFVYSLSCLFGMDLVERKLFFLQSTPPVAQAITGGNRS